MEIPKNAIEIKTGNIKADDYLVYASGKMRIATATGPDTLCTVKNWNSSGGNSAVYRVQSKPDTIRIPRSATKILTGQIELGDYLVGVKGDKSIANSSFVGCRVDTWLSYKGKSAIYRLVTRKTKLQLLEKENAMQKLQIASLQQKLDRVKQILEQTGEAYGR